MQTCKDCRWKITMPYSPEQLALAKRGEGIPEQSQACTKNPPTPVAIVVMVNDPRTGQLRPMQTIQTAYPAVDDATPACGQFEWTLVRQPTKLGAVK